MQRRSDGSRRFYATDLVNFLGCSHATVLDLRELAGEIKSGDATESDQLIWKKGLEHERAYLKRHKDEGKSVVEIPTEAPDAERARLTREALRAGPGVIYQAALGEGGWAGFADFLEKKDKPSDLGPYSYEVVDTKLAKNPEVKHLIQLGIYSDLLGKHQGRPPDSSALFLGSNKKEEFRVRDFDAYIRHAQRRLEGFVAAPPADSYPEPCAHCQHCHWRETCCAQWINDDHLTQVANLTRTQSKRLQQAGINTVAQLAALPPSTHITGLHPLIFERLRSQAALQADKRATNNDRFEILARQEGRGFARLPQPNPGDLFFDMEGDPLHPDGLEYLFGVCVKQRDELGFHSFWAHNHDEERETFGKFMEFVFERMKAHPGAYIYHYNHYEITAIRRLASRYLLFERELDDLLRAWRFVDLFKVVREAIRISEPSYSLKNVEIFYLGKRREGKVASADESIVVYNRWRETQDPDLLRQIEEYNRLDCESTAYLRDWLLEIRPDGIEWFTGPSEPADADKNNERSAERQTEEEQYRKVRAQLSAAATDGKDDFRHVLADLLEFHARENKPNWWEHFDRKDRTEDEWLEDPECLAGLKLVGDPVPQKKSLVHTFRFPAQETKRRAGEQVIDVATMNSAGAIVELDEKRLLVRIKRGAKNGSLPDRLTIGPRFPFDKDRQRDAIYRFAGEVLGNAGKYSAVRDILQKSVPRFHSRRAGEVIARGSDLLTAALEAAADLDQSYLIIQGPPGAGKTYTSAHVLIELMRRGNKVGVSALSHKAINNLLTQVERMAVKYGFQFSGVKKAKEDDDLFHGKFIHNCPENNDVDLDANLLAGTAWLFADARFDQRIDYLLIDEAGQVATADVVAMGTAARNILLAGDQMQLGQPTRAAHPEGAGLSILEYLLPGQATVSPERGIFLNTTHRLHPSICTFISEVFYDGKLQPDEANQRRRLIFDRPIAGIRPQGVHFVPIAHDGFSQRCDVEAEVIREFYRQILGQRFENENGTTHEVELADILVVSPYNAQVNNLASILPAGARVGTVDKFQGQEAPVVLISMATSDAECMPRNLDFLFSANRLNVAISRAQCLAIVVASPKLLETPCQQIEHLKLVNNFCKLAEYAAATCST